MKRLSLLLLFISQMALGQDMSNSLGVVTITRDFEATDKTIEFLNDDDSVWYSITLFDSYKWRNDFNVLAFEPDYLLVKLKCKEVTEDAYIVVVNEATGQCKRLVKSSKYKLLTWEEYVQNVFGIDYNKQSQTLLDMIDGRPIAELPEPEDILVPKQVQGDWMEVIWTKSEYPDDTTENQSAWLRWREGDVIIIQLYHLS